MAKTVYVDGSILTPTKVDLEFGNSATTGHRHTGLNNDGSQPRIQPASDLHPTIGNLIPNINMIDSVAINIDISFDGNTTYTQLNVPIILSRVGTHTILKLGATTISGVVTGNVNIVFRPSAGLPWDADFFGMTETISSSGPGTNSAVGPPTFRLVYLRFQDVNTHIQIFVDEDNVWPNGATAAVTRHACFSFLQV